MVGDKHDSSGNRENWRIFLGKITWFWDIVLQYPRERERKKKRSSSLLQECHRNNREDLPNFRVDSKLHIVLLKQRSLELEPPWLRLG